MRKFISAVALTWLAITPAFADDDPPIVIFNRKSFIDLGKFVHVEGTLAGEGIGYKHNRSALTCYQETHECSAIIIEAEGRQVFSIGVPTALDIRVWTADRIVADSGIPCGLMTWIIDRTRQTAEMIEQPCSETKVYHWTIEDPPIWKETVEPLAKPER